jgi:dihydropyrimidine dehydrogenase (NAD+) subunit PreT
MNGSENPGFQHRNPFYLSESWRAKVEAERCLNCFDAPCIAGCPTRINIPEFIGRIRSENLAGAYDTLIQKNPLPAICGLVCPTEYLCEGKCLASKLYGRPVEIAALQYYVCTKAQTDEVWKTTRTEKIAVVGGGPSGIACALRLRQNGYSVDVYDSHQLAGGLLMYSIPNYRLPDRSVSTELSRLERSGIRFHMGEAVDARMLESIIGSSEAVFLGIGMGSGKDLSTPGGDLEGVISALDYLEKMRRPARGDCERPMLKGQIVIVGGGNVALDAACVAARAGAEHVTVLYRRTREQMPAWESEYQDALRLGVEFRWLVGVNEILGKGGKVTGVRINKMRLMDSLDSSSRKRVEAIPGAEDSLDCEAAILAVGQALDFAGLSNMGIKISNEGLIQVDPKTFHTSHPKVFAGGDAINGGTYVVQAISEGWKAAEAIHQYINGDGKS